jgi:large subunit ribosomal protein L23
MGIKIYRPTSPGRRGMSTNTRSEVTKKANKIEIRKAVEMVFGVRVSDVRTMVVRGDVRRVGRFFGRRPFWKKAVVTLHAGDSIDFYGEQADQAAEG